MDKAIDGGLANYRLDWDQRTCVTVVMASGGYPGEFQKGMEIEGLSNARSVRDVMIFHAGTKLGKRASDTKNLFVTNGGRVLNVTALGNDIKGAIENCYNAVMKIKFGRMHYRKDIGHKAFKI